jgi:hypothetical protein
VDAPATLNKKITNTALTKNIFDHVLSSEVTGTDATWTPPGSIWKDTGDFFKDATEFGDPIQGAIGNCWLIAALSAVAWADPLAITHRNRATGPGETDRTNAIQLYSQGGSHDGPTGIVEVTDTTLVDAGGFPLYCRSADPGEIWPAVYEKAFAKWSTKNTTDQPDISALAYGWPYLAVAQITNKTPYVYYTDARTASQLYEIVRENSLSFKTINPMTAWTYGSGPTYGGSNIVANHAYTILGWAWQGAKEYIVLRNPWGFTEPAGLNTYQGLLSFFDGSFWRPINTIGDDGVFALEAPSFKYYFAGMSVNK